SITDEHSQCAPDVDDRITAYFDLAWLQQQLISATGRCSHQSSDYFQNPIDCNRKSVAFCQSCGQGLCLEDIERANCATVREHCKRGTKSWVRSQMRNSIEFVTISAITRGWYLRTMSL